MSPTRRDGASSSHGDALGGERPECGCGEGKSPRRESGPTRFLTGPQTSSLWVGSLPISHPSPHPGSGFNSPKVLSPRNKTCSRLLAGSPGGDPMAFPGPDGQGRWLRDAGTARYRGHGTAAGTDRC